VPWLLAAAKGALPGDRAIEWEVGSAVTVVLASAGYPGEFERGKRIEGLDDAERVSGATVFHAGTRRGPSGGIETAGGRVLTVTGVGATLDAAARTAYDAAGRIRFDGVMFRRDIAEAARRKL